MKTYLVCFHTGEAKFVRGMRRLTKSASVGGIDEVVVWDRQMLKQSDRYTGPMSFNRRPHGFVYGWKPYIILDLMRQIPLGDTVIYYDVGGASKEKEYEFQRPLSPLLEWCWEEAQGILPGLYTGYPHSQWTTRDCFVFMDCDCERYWNLKQIQATFSIWQKSELSLHVLRQWGKYCDDPRTIDGLSDVSGLPQLPGFKEHRYDQSIITNLAERETLKCYGKPLPRGGFKKINRLVERVANGED
jgi:hypothetical protein